MSEQQTDVPVSCAGVPLLYRCERCGKRFTTEEYRDHHKDRSTKIGCGR